MEPQKYCKVGIIMGSESDRNIMNEASNILDLFGVSHELKIVSAHRTPDMMYDYAKNAEKRGIKIIIAGAGGAAHLPGMTAALTILPVIGIPIVSPTNTMGGLDSLLSIVQMPTGTPVATMGTNKSENAALFAISILALSDSLLSEQLTVYKNSGCKKIF